MPWHELGGPRSFVMEWPFHRWVATLKPLIYEVNNLDNVVTMLCSAGKWVPGIQVKTTWHPLIMPVIMFTPPPSELPRVGSWIYSRASHGCSIRSGSEGHIEGVWHCHLGVLLPWGSNLGLQQYLARWCQEAWMLGPKVSQQNNVISYEMINVRHSNCQWSSWFTWFLWFCVCEMFVCVCRPQCSGHQQSGTSSSYVSFPIDINGQSLHHCSRDDTNSGNWSH